MNPIHCLLKNRIGWMARSAAPCEHAAEGHSLRVALRAVGGHGAAERPIHHASRLFPQAVRLSIQLAVAIFSSLLLASSPWAAAAERPNFVIFITDDQAFNGMSGTGNTVLQTPNLDRLAESGVLFEKAFVTTSICCVSRTSIYTGQHMRRHGIEDFQKPLSAAQWRETFPALLRAAGYRTGFLGKFAIGSPAVDRELALPEKQFDLWYGFPQKIEFKQMVDGKPRYLTTIMEEKAAQFLADSKDRQPFCLIVALKEPHGPLTYSDPEFQPPYANATLPSPVNLTRESYETMPEAVRHGLNDSSKWLDNPELFQTATRKVYAYVHRADVAVGRICAALKANGLDENTVIIHISDNGCMEGAHALDGKWMMYEESIRVPLIIRDPRRPAATQGKRSQMALNIDLAPTILAMADVPVPDGMQGQNLQPVLKDAKTKGREDWYYEHTYNTTGSRKRIPASEGVRTDRWKYIRYTGSQPPLEQLFDLDADPHEERNLVADASHEATLAKLRARCDEYRETLR